MESPLRCIRKTPSCEEKGYCKEELMNLLMQEETENVIQ